MNEYEISSLKAEVFAFKLGLIVAVIIAIIIVSLVGIDMRQLKEEAIKRNFAEYNSKTGEWQWKGPKVKE